MTRLGALPYGHDDADDEEGETERDQSGTTVHGGPGQRLAPIAAAQSPAPTLCSPLQERDVGLRPVEHLFRSEHGDAPTG